MPHAKMHALCYSGVLANACISVSFDTAEERDAFIASTPKTRKWRADNYRGAFSAFILTPFVHNVMTKTNVSGVKRCLAAERDVTSRGIEIEWNPVGVLTRDEFKHLLKVQHQNGG